ncbi:ABC transporter ATP-binding protein [Holosporaceae bacterium 'Namur']|nr:ABC transporter ATP-binding protein [Holosporaceae bacterium 'Namur']
MFVLEVKEIEKKFKQSHVLNNISFSISRGEVFGLVGLNGIGKTTLIKIILNLLLQDKGEVTIFSNPNTDLKSKSLIAYLPEKFNPSPFLKGREFLELSMGYYGLDYNSQEAEILCNQLGLKFEALERRISSYSKGMGQKLGLISVFLTRAPLLILDEPMSGLDPSARIALKKKLISYKAEGNSIFFSSHILADIEEICDRIGVIHKGGLIFEGSSKEFISKYPADSLEESFLSAINL